MTIPLGFCVDRSREALPNNYGENRRRSPDPITYGCLYYYTPVEWDFDPLIHRRPAKHQQIRVRYLSDIKDFSLNYVAVSEADSDEIIGIVPTRSLSPDYPKRIRTPDPDPCQHRDSGRGVCVECGTFLEDKTWRQKTQKNTTCSTT